MIGGVEATEGEFPAMAALGFVTGDRDLSWNCGAVLISLNFLLTAAHCFSRSIAPSKVRVGATDLDDPSARDIDIKNATIHPLFNATTKHHDIAVIELVESVSPSGRVQPASLYLAPNDPPGLTLTGWGVSEEGRSKRLRKARLVPVPVEACNGIYGRRMFGRESILPSQICAGGHSKDSCYGDSGGPLFVRKESGEFSVVGIVSFGLGCGGSAPGVYTRVSSYSSWIESVLAGT